MFVLYMGNCWSGKIGKFGKQKVNNIELVLAIHAAQSPILYPPFGIFANIFNASSKFPTFGQHL